MKVRIWIDGPDGSSRDFELLSAPCVGERISIAVGGKTEEGVVASVSWHLQAIETSPADLTLEGDPMGTVSLVHVICRPATETLRTGYAAAEIDLTSEAQGSA